VTNAYKDNPDASFLLGMREGFEEVLICPKL